MASIEYGMRSVKGGLEDDASLGSALAVVFAIVVFPFILVPFIETRGRRTAESRGPRRSFKLTRTLPLWPTREPQHEPIKWIILFAEMGGEEESCGGELER